MKNTSSLQTTPFREAIAWASSPASQDGEAHGLMPADWTQGRTMFGGLVAAALVRGMRSYVAGERDLRSLLVSFVGPVVPGPVRMTVNVLRAGRSTTQAEARLFQGEDVQCVALATFGADRDSQARVAPPMPPAAPPPDGLADIAMITGKTPVFLQHYGMRWGLGEQPFSGAARGDIGGYCRFQEDAGRADEEALLTLIDAWPPAIFPVLRRPAPSSTVTWSVSFASVRRELSASDWWLFSAHTSAAGNGYADTSGMLWDPQGRLVAHSTQLVAVFDAASERQ